MSTQQDPLAMTTVGSLRGKWDDDVALFCGVPYAQAPIGERRFAPPAPVGSWDGIRDAVEFGPICPQNPSMLDAVFGQLNPEQSEDCLTLNIWSSAFDGDGRVGTGDSGRPVVVWIHGGGFEMGAATQAMYSGDSFARNGTVFVSINYRLGTLGFMELGELDPAFAGSGSNGLLDQICALRWVHDNIAAFGGNPDEITVFGQSAGSMSIAFLLSSGALRGVVRRVICQSGAASLAVTPKVAQMSTDAVVRQLGATSVADLQAADVSDLLKAHAAIGVARIGNSDSTLQTTGDLAAFLPFRPVADGRFVPLDPLAAIAGGSGLGIDMICGTTSDEWTLFGMMDPGAGDLDVLRKRLAMLGPDADEALEHYRMEHPEADTRALMTAVMSDAVFRVPAHDLADAQFGNGMVWMYRFAWGTPVFGGALGATHGIELPFQFDNLDLPGAPAFVSDAPPAALVEYIHGSTVAFAVNGEPGMVGGVEWPPYDPNGQAVLKIDTECELLHRPYPQTRSVWQRTA